MKSVSRPVSGAGFLAWAAILCADALSAAEPLVLADFEDGMRPFEQRAGMEIVAEHATHGQKALKVDADTWIGAADWNRLPKDWSAYDLVKMDIFNPTDKEVKMGIQMRDPMGGRGYWAWHNRYVALLPGENNIEFAIADLWRGEVLRNDIPGKLDAANITTINMHADGPFYLDYLRLESFPAPRIEVPGLKAFDVGRTGTPGFPGFAQLTEKDAYTKEKGYGWLKTDFSRMDDRIHPDNLFRDSLACRNCELAIDLPNGKYRVHMQLEDPGYWEFMQNYTQRTVRAEGTAVVDETMDAAEFLKRFFRNQDSEDFPGEDPFEKYVEPRHPWHVFDVEVKDGQLNFDFKSPSTYGNTLSALVIYPAEHSEKGAAFMDYVKALRKFNWAQRWKPVSKPARDPVFIGKMAADAQRDGFVLFHIAPHQPAYSYDHVPADAEDIERLTLTASLGEYEPCSFGLRPARDIGRVDVAVSNLADPNGAAITPENITVRVGRYRFVRHAGNQSGLYAVTEKQLQLFNQPGAENLICNNTLVRRFWITVRVPDDAAPGDYTGKVTVKAEKGGTRTIPISLRVLPIRLPEPDHLFALYGINVLPVPYYPEMKARMPQLVEAMYRDLRAHGINYIPDLSADVAWETGKAVVKNVDEIDKDLAVRRALGFRDGPVDLPGGCSLDELASKDTIRGLPKKDFITAWHKEMTDTFKAHAWPHPYFCYGDEPNIPETLNALTAANNAVHAVSPDIWMGIAYHVQSPESYELLKTLDVSHLKRFCKRDDFLTARKYAKVLVACNIGMGRADFGLREWYAAKEMKADGGITYSYTGSHVDIYYGLDAREDDYNLAPPRMDGTLTTTSRWEQIREGIDDFRYTLALEKLTADPAASAQAKTAAQALLTRALEIGGGGKEDALQQSITWRADAQKVLSSR